VNLTMQLKFLSVVLCLICTPVLAAGELKIAEIGDLPLESGGRLKSATIAYHTAGKLNEDRSNIIVFPTWFTGTSGQLIDYGLIGPGKLADTDRFYVIAIGALANGVSTSPSNSEEQAGTTFPSITIDDMVTSQHMLLTRHLGIEHVHLVMGISMGGMQTFQWIGQYPEFMDKAISIDGSPCATSYDLLQWGAHKQAIDLLQGAGVANDVITDYLATITLLTLWTPSWFVENVAPEDIGKVISESEQSYEQLDANDYRAQLGAMMDHNVFVSDTGGQTTYTDTVKAQVLVIGVASDHMVNPTPGKDLAQQLGARHLEVRSNCGHIGSTGCEAKQVLDEVRAFLE
jgi:homoserine O-acetyltransferase